MSSLITGFENDIFISCRQSNNKHNGWATRFVDNLKSKPEAAKNAVPINSLVDMKLVKILHEIPDTFRYNSFI